MWTVYGKPRWTWLAAWTLVGACAALGVSTLGIFTSPDAGLIQWPFGFAGAMVVGFAWRGGAAPLGFVAGVGAMLTGIALVNVAHTRPCGRYVEAHLNSSLIWPFGLSCGVVHDQVCMIVGIIILTVAILAYLRAAVLGGIRR